MMFFTNGPAIVAYRPGAGPLPPPMPANLLVWLDALQVVGIGDGNPLALWPDMSGNANNAAGVIGWGEPTYHANIGDGKPAVRFDGVNDLLAIADTVPLRGPEFTIFVVCSISTAHTPGGASIINKADWTGHVFGYDLSSYGDLEFSAYTEPAGVLTYVDTGFFLWDIFHIAAIRFDGTVASVRFDGGAWASVDGGRVLSPAATPIRIAGVYNGDFGPPDYMVAGCDVREVLVYDIAMADAQVVEARDFLNTKWAVYV